MSRRIVQSVIAKCLIINMVCFTGLASAILMHFELNKAYYAASECILAGEEGNSCQGSCCLASLMEPVQDNEQSPSTLNLTDTNVVWIIPELENPIPELMAQKAHPDFYLQVPTDNFVASSYTPPEVLS